MLENPVDSSLLVGHPTDSDNVRDAEDQQERLVSGTAERSTERESSETIRRPSHFGEMKIWSGPYGDVGRSAETTGPPTEAVQTR
jgi:hypothetical protein